MIPSQIVDQVERLAPLWYAARTNVYRELRRLTADELVEASEPIESLRWATSYKITEKGVSAYENWRTDIEPRDYLQDPILLRCALDMMNNGKFDSTILEAGAVSYRKLVDKVLTASDDRFVPLIRDHYRIITEWLEHERSNIAGVPT